MRKRFGFFLLGLLLGSQVYAHEWSCELNSKPNEGDHYKFHITKGKGEKHKGDFEVSLRGDNPQEFKFTLSQELDCHFSTVMGHLVNCSAVIAGDHDTTDYFRLTSQVESLTSLDIYSGKPKTQRNLTFLVDSPEIRKKKILGASHEEGIKITVPPKDQVLLQNCGLN